MARHLACAVAIAALVHACRGHPSDWIAEHAPTACQAHPEQILGTHMGWAIDSAISFQLRVTNQEITSVCPGETHTLLVSFPDSRQMLITASEGTLTVPGVRDASCPNRVGLDVQRPALQATWVVPCSVSDSVKVRVTSATGEFGGFLTSTLSLKVSPGCAAPACRPPVAASPPPSPPPPNPPPSPRPPLPPQPPNVPVGEPLRPPLLPPSPSPPAPPTPPSPPPPTPPPPSPTPPAPLQVPAMLSVSSPVCQPSPWGYDCARQLSPVAVLHYSLGDSVPSNLCTQAAAAGTKGQGAAASRGVTQEQKQQGLVMVHMALEGRTTGYSSVGWTEKPGYMAPSEALLGFVDDLAGGLPIVKAYRVSGYEITERDALPDSWAEYQGVVQTSDGRTITCFGRATRDVKAAQLIWALGGDTTDGFGDHPHFGGFILDLTNPSGLAVEAVPVVKYWVLVHAVLLTVAWAALAPLAVVLSRHRWLFSDVKLAGCSTALWFQLHVFLVWTVAALTAAGFAIAYTHFPNAKNYRGKPQTQIAHHILGLVVLILLGIQGVVAHLARPKPGASLRGVWNLVHVNSGRLLLLLATCTTVTGAVMYHRVRDASLVRWLCPLLIVPLALLFVSLALDVLKERRRSHDDTVTTSTTSKAGATGGATKQPTIVMGGSKMAANGQQGGSTLPSSGSASSQDVSPTAAAVVVEMPMAVSKTNGQAAR